MISQVAEAHLYLPPSLSKQRAAPEPKSGSFCENQVDMRPLGRALLQALQYLPISKVLSVVNELPEVGQEDEKVRVDDIQGSASPGCMDTSISGKKLVSFPLGLCGEKKIVILHMCCFVT